MPVHAYQFFFSNVQGARFGGSRAVLPGAPVSCTRRAAGRAALAAAKEGQERSRKASDLSLVTGGDGRSQPVDDGEDEQGNQEDNGGVQPHLVNKEPNNGKARKDSGDDTGILEGGDQEPSPLGGGIVPEYSASTAPRVLGEAQERKEEKGAS